MDSGYQPKYPRAKLRDIVTKHLGALRLAGLRPNSTAVFGLPPAQGGEARAWLIQDPRQRVTEVRYLLLDDGDVWREVDAPQNDGATTDRRRRQLQVDTGRGRPGRGRRPRPAGSSCRSAGDRHFRRSRTPS